MNEIINENGIYEEIEQIGLGNSIHYPSRFKQSIIKSSNTSIDQYYGTWYIDNMNIYTLHGIPLYIDIDKISSKFENGHTIISLLYTIYKRHTDSVLYSKYDLDIKYAHIADNINIFSFINKPNNRIMTTLQIISINDINLLSSSSDSEGVKRLGQYLLDNNLFETSTDKYLKDISKNVSFK